MTKPGPYRIMVVDDSAVIRGLLTRALESDPAVEVVASVSDGQQGIRALGRHDVEVVILDIEMPVMDGLTALPKMIEAKPGVQVVVASTLTRKNAEISLRALQLGAADYIAKPSSKSELHGAKDFKRELTEKVKALGAAVRGGQAPAPSGKVRPAARAGRDQAKAAPLSVSKAVTLRKSAIIPPEAIAIGSSTGGPQALLKLLTSLASPIRQPIFITQHMPATFTTLLAEHISRATSFDCAEAVDGEVVVGGRIYLAPGGFHMLVRAKGAQQVIRLTEDPPENFCRPAVDPMLRSLNDVYGPRLMVVILTGMGSDGQRGCARVVETGGTVIAQDEATSVVWGMPGAVAGAGLCTAILPLTEIAPYVSQYLMRPAA